jgi:MinD superfamily P-loop ATPase
MSLTNNNCKQLVVLSGKGGTGKTTITAALVHLARETPLRAVQADADVDAANLALVTGNDVIHQEAFWGSKTGRINPAICSGCGRCLAICRFDAIIKLDGNPPVFQIDPLRCDGCAACVYECPASAIRMEKVQDGNWFHSNTRYGHQFHAELFPGAENSGKLVTTVKQHAKLYAEDERITLVLLDGPPGIGCPVISASAGADLALLVTEPGLSGQHDLLRVVETLAHFNVPGLVCINKADLYPAGTAAIRKAVMEKGLQIAGEIPFDAQIPRALTATRPITDYAPQSPSARAIRNIWAQILTALNLEVPDAKD